MLTGVLFTILSQAWVSLPIYGKVSSMSVPALLFVVASYYGSTVTTRTSTPVTSHLSKLFQKFLTETCTLLSSSASTPSRLSRIVIQLCLRQLCRAQPYQLFLPAPIFQSIAVVLRPFNFWILSRNLTSAPLALLLRPPSSLSPQQVNTSQGSSGLSTLFATLGIVSPPRIRVSIPGAEIVPEGIFPLCVIFLVQTLSKTLPTVVLLSILLWVF